MKLKVTQENLTKAVGLAARVASTRGTLPILANILLKVTDNRLTVSATNLDIAISCGVGAQIQAEGALTVPARLLQDLVSGLPAGVIELEQDEQRLKVTTDSYKSVINGVTAEDFPVMPAIDGGAQWSLGGNDLKVALQQVLMAASSDESRPVLTGVYMCTDENKTLHLAATDSYRLAEKQLGTVAADVKVLVPASALQDVSRIIHDYSGTVDITNDEQQIRFQAGDVELVARLIDGNYPDYQKLIPAEFAVQADLSRSELVNITKVSSLFARESAGSIVLSVDEPSQSIWIHAVANQLGENNATAQVEATGSGSITLNSRYLLDALQAMDGSQVSIGFNGKLEAVLLKTPDAPDYLHIIMPLKS